MNPGLAAAISNAKKAQFSKISIEAAIAKGQGKSLSGAPLESLTVEAMLPFSVAAIIECQTDSRARALQELRSIITRNGGTVTPTSYLFEKKGRTVFEKNDDVNPDDILEGVIEAGALDVDVDNEGRIFIDTEPTELAVVTQRLLKAYNLKTERSSVIYDPRQETAVAVSVGNAEELENILSLIEDEPSVQDVYTNAT